MRRRRLLGLTGTVLSTAVAGCNTDGGRWGLGESGDSASAVTNPVYDLWSAYNDEDAERIVDLYHPDADAPDASSIEFEATVTVESTTVVSQSDDTATVEAEVTISGERNESQSQVFELRTYEGEWKIWSYEVAEDGSSAPSTP